VVRRFTRLGVDLTGATGRTKLLVRERPEAPRLFGELHGVELEEGVQPVADLLA